ncbi:MAG TPA: hypothetical protein P5528_13570 [Steroidobacteraceae bacterium]|nr:hypothetical protein [Steroidobacteraceae bacterium]HRX90465.1 hypothetical protein [Steroidobacteraceae bacterium]
MAKKKARAAAKTTKPKGRTSSLRATTRAAKPARRAVMRETSDREFLTRQRIEDLGQGFVTLAGELWVVKDRLAVMENLLDKHGIPAHEIDTHEPDEAFKEQLAKARKAYIQRVIASLFPRGMPKAG